MSLSFFKNCFKVTAVGNLIAGLGAMLLPIFHLEKFYGINEIDSVLSFYHYNFWLCVLLLGIAYWHLSKKPFELRIIALIGAIGKLAIAIYWIYMLLNGEAKPLVILGIIYDGFFGIVMAWFYFFANRFEPNKTET